MSENILEGSCGCENKEEAESLFEDYIGTTRALQHWFHAAHHVTKGKGFAGDHNILYSKIYNLLGEDLDALIEKGIGLYDEEQLACPIIISKLASKMICNFDSPVNLGDHEIACIALEVLKYHIIMLNLINLPLVGQTPEPEGFEV